MHNSHGAEYSKGVDCTTDSHGNRGKDDDDTEEELSVDRVGDLTSNEAEE